jgi:cell pole-organizing protein PopZ
MSSVTSKQDMSMDDILASIRSYVSEGQTFPKGEASLATEKRPYTPEVIQLTDEVLPIETISLAATQPLPSFTPMTPVEKSEVGQNSMHPNSQPAQNPFQTPDSDNPFNRLQSEIVASIPAPPTLSPDELLNQLATPLIKNWLDQNLRKIVEGIVEKEIERMRRG